MDFELVECPDMNKVQEDYRRRPFKRMNDALICGKPIPPPQKVWKFKETKDILGRKKLENNGGAENVPIPKVQGMKEILGKYLFFAINPDLPKTL